MSLNARKVPSTGGGDRVVQPNLEPGSYPARLVQVLDMGLQPQRAFQGQEKPPAYDIRLTYELSDEFMIDADGNELTDKPRWLSEQIPMYSLEVDLAKSTKRYYALDPKETYKGDFIALIGATCMVNVVNSKPSSKGIIYDNVAGLSSMRPKEAAKAPELVNPPKVFALDDPDLEVFGSLPQWIQDIITSNLEFSNSALDKALQGSGNESAESKSKGELEDEIPFDQEDSKESSDSSDDDDW